MAESIVSDVTSKIRIFENNDDKKVKNVVPPKRKIKAKIDQFNKMDQEEADVRPKLKKGKSKRISKAINQKVTRMKKRAALPIPTNVDAPVPKPLGMIILKVPN